MSTASRHLRAVSPSVSAPAPLGGVVTIDMERYVQLLTLEILAAEAIARTWQHRHRGHQRMAVGLTDAMAGVVEAELVDMHLSEREQKIRRAERGERES